MSIMLGVPRLCLTLVLLAPLPLMAQQGSGSPSATTSPASVPAAPTPAGVVATTNNPNLAVATVKLESGTRATKLIGSAVYNETNEKVGSIDDLIMTRDDKVTVAIIAVGGFLGVGSKLVAVPWQQLRLEADKIVLAGATKDSLNGMPNFQY